MEKSGKLDKEVTSRAGVGLYQLQKMRNGKDARILTVDSVARSIGYKVTFSRIEE